ncbi:3-hydroxy-5-phosphonooxypentane-2,4-dione thiolase [Desulfobacterota bacterium AH_259_B03_O07]|nr:3-hydroxy-5-phosphonooxypentane-2,4-dione thiolase [Desulfobacterota bacterium AH_259_B03_O07]
MDWGMENRMARIIKPDTGRTVMLALDHGYFLGPTHRIEEPRKTIEPLLPYADTIMLTRGVLRTSVDPKSITNVVLRVSGGVSIIGPSLSDEGLTTSLKDAIRLNVAGIGISVFVGTDHERQTLLNLAELVNLGEDYGIPVLGITAVGKELEKRDARFLSLCCRICAELGTHIVKTYYCEDFEKVTNGCPAPIVIAGGPKLETEVDVLEMTYNAIEQGAVGVDMGRNIWQNDHPVAMIRAIRSVVHEGFKPKQAHELFKSIKAEQPKKVASV